MNGPRPASRSDSPLSAARDAVKQIITRGERDTHVLQYLQQQLDLAHYPDHHSLRLGRQRHRLRHGLRLWLRLREQRQRLRLWLRLQLRENQCVVGLLRKPLFYRTVFRIS